MKAVRFEEYDGPEVLQDVPEPSPGCGEVVVRGEGLSLLLPVDSRFRGNDG